MAQTNTQSSPGAMPLAELIRQTVTGFLPAGLIEALIDRVEGPK